MCKKNIIIVGFPKSGTTWASRLVAELVECPLVGDWGFDHVNSLYKDGLNRISEFQCYKSHHTYDEIKKVTSSSIYKIIYIIRDPRDIVISGIHYFNFSTFITKILRKTKAYKVEILFKKIFNPSLSEKQKKKRMINAVLYGSKSINYWLKTSWKEHYDGYLDKNILFIRYEDLLELPEVECEKIMQYLQIENNSTRIKESIKKQSFQKRKQEVSNLDNTSLKKLIRKGSQKYWKEDFSKNEITLFKKKIGNSSSFYKF